MKRLVALLVFLSATTAFAQIGTPPGITGAPTATSTAAIASTGASSTTATLGSELATNPTFTGNITGWTGTNWAYEAANKARHTAGSTDDLTQNITVATLTRYLVSVTQTGRTAGSFQVKIGSQSLQGGAYWDEDQVFESTQTGTVALKVTPTTDYDGALTKVSIKAFATLVPNIFHFSTGLAANKGVGPGGISYGMNVRYSDGTLGGGNPYGMMIGYESGVNALAGGGANLAFGDRALEQVTTGYWNHAFGYQALLHNTTGIQNSAYGKWAMANNTTGSFNVAFGDEALISQRTSSGNASVGWRSLNSVTTGSSNSALGSQAGRGMTTGGNNVCLGTAACYSPAGSAANVLTTGSNNTNLGVQTGQGSTTQRSNSTAVGYYATYDADNWVTVGNTSVTDVSFGGSTALARSRQAINRTTKYIEGSSPKTLVDAAGAASVWSCAIPSNDYLAGEVVWSAKSTDGTDYRVLQGRNRFTAVNKAGTVFSGANASAGPTTTMGSVGTDQAGGSTTNTLTCTWTQVISTTNLLLQATCTDDLAGSQTISMNSRLDMPITQTCTAQ